MSDPTRQMDGGRRVLVLGASGLIGQAILEAARGHPSLELLPASHRDRAGYVRVDYASLTTQAAWIDVLRAHGVAAVINCVGIWSGSVQEFELVQCTVPVALFDACAALGVRVVHVSALGFSEISPLPYVSTKARADRHLLECGADGVVVYPSLVFGSAGASTQFFLSLAALPVHIEFGFGRNLQPVHVRDVGVAVVSALLAREPPRVVVCAGRDAISVSEYLALLRAGMGFRPKAMRVHLPRWCARLLFEAGERMGARFVNRQTWTLLESGTHSARPHPDALPYEAFATPSDRQRVRDTQLYWFARLGMAFLWLWTALVTFFAWPRDQTLAWLESLWPGLGTPLWLTASCVLDAAMGLASLWMPSRRLWLGQFALTAVYTVGLAFALPWSWAHPLGPLTKNLAVLCTMLFLAGHEPAHEPAHEPRRCISS